jgi:hypothetical protein
MLACADVDRAIEVALLKEPGGALGVGEVFGIDPGARISQLRCDVLQLIAGAAPVHGHAPSVFGQPESDGAANSTAGASDQNPTMNHA